MNKFHPFTYCKRCWTNQVAKVVGNRRFRRSSKVDIKQALLEGRDSPTPKFSMGH